MYDDSAAAICGNITENVIDCDAKPFVSRGSRILSDEEQLPNRVTGRLRWDPTKIGLHLDRDQLDRCLIEGNRLREKLKNVAVLRASVLDFLLDHQGLIPDDWKQKMVTFWGTIFSSPEKEPYVYCLFWFGGWRRGWVMLELSWDSDYPAAKLLK